MLINKQFYAERVMKTIHKICVVSEFMDPIAPDKLSNSEIKRYLLYSKRRLSVVSKEFKQLGYKTITQKFKFNGKIATNALFYRGNISDGIVLFVAHHDYRAGLGAEDNGSALAMMLELTHCLRKSESRIMFASFDLEELGLLGSRHFVATISDRKLQKLSGVIALECLGSGKDVVICQAVSGAISDPKLVSDLQRAASKSGHRIVTESFDWFSADHVSFAKRGIKTVEISSFNLKNYRDGPAPDVNVAHSNLDVPKNILPSTIKACGEILLQFLKDF